jgi:hypothetical protein
MDAARPFLSIAGEEQSRKNRGKASWSICVRLALEKIKLVRIKDEGRI